MSAQSAESRYQVVENWATFPDGVTAWSAATGVDIDPRNGNIYVFHRNESMPIMAFDKNGKFLRAWGQGMFKTTHFLRTDREGNVWVTDRGDHQVFKFSPEGKLLLTLGKKGVIGDNESRDAFNGVADLVIARNGDIFIADGESTNTRVVKYSKDGKFVSWWGGLGKAPGQFDEPHSIAIDSDGRLYVGDRRNKRVQVFDQGGKFLKEWTHLGTPWGVFVKGDRLYVVDGTEANVPSHRQHEGRQGARPRRRSAQRDGGDRRCERRDLHRRSERDERAEAGEEDYGRWSRTLPDSGTT